MEARDAQPGRVLIVDDSPQILQMLQKRLAAAGWDVTLATGGMAGLAKVATAAPEVLLVDHHMPDIDGLELLRRVRATEEERLPVIVLSGERDLARVLEVVHDGAFDVVPKDALDDQVLFSALGRALLFARRMRETHSLSRHLQHLSGELSSRNVELNEERRRSERLLLSILPAGVASRLKSGETAIADALSDVTVLFADLVGFTRWSAGKPAAEVLARLNQVMTTFDRLASGHRVEKIKTIGDAYMCAAGLPEPRADHARAVAAMALDMQPALDEWNARSGEALSMRIGMASGPVVAGVIGGSKFIYDLWGDTVNAASRMESTGVPGRIQVWPDTARLLDAEFELEPRGPVEVKGIGTVTTWYLNGRRQA